MPASTRDISERGALALREIPLAELDGTDLLKITLASRMHPYEMLREARQGKREDLADESSCSDSGGAVLFCFGIARRQ